MFSSLLKDVKAIQALIDLLPIAIFVKDSENKIVLMNAACESIWGVKFEQIQGTDGSQFFPENEIQQFNHKDHEIFRNRTQMGFEESFWNSGLRQSRVGQTLKKPYYDDNGDPLFMLCTTLDITEIKQAQKLSSVNEANLRILFEDSPLGMTLKLMDGRFVEVNKAFSEIVGYSPEMLRGLSCLDLTSSAYLQKEAQQLAGLQENAQYGPYDKEYIRSDGQFVPVRLNGVRIVGHDNQPCIWSIVEDITEYRKIESDLKVAATAFEANVGILITDASSTILRVNTTFTEQTGYTHDEVVGKTPRILKSNVHDHAFYAQMWSTLHQAGTWQGEIWDRRKTGEIYPKWMTIKQIKDDAGNVTHYVGTQHDISYRKQTEEKIRHLINFDALSELPNRRMLMEQLDQAQERSTQSGQYGALLFLDVDNFKHLNDTRGHHYGDLFIIEVARRLRGSVNRDCSVARLGGDEFLIMMENIGTDTDIAVSRATVLSEKIHNAISKAFILEGLEYFASASIGITLFQGHKDQKVALLTQADVAMYEAKKAGKNTQRFFDPEMQNALEQRAKLESSLRQALAKKQLKLFYQVQVNHLGLAIGVEALIRWDHPEFGLISPAQFIPLAEETHLILPIGSWVLETACHQLKRWQSKEQFRHLSISVNISALQFKQSDFVEQTQAIVARCGVSPQQLKLELTESIVLDDVKEAIAKMLRLKSLGFLLSMDDFGTGYSSLNYLRRLPFDQLKIDRSFISNLHDNPHDAYVIEMIAAMGERFGMDVIAEGVETSKQYQYLSALSFEAFQGYYFGKPSPVEDLEQTLFTRYSLGN